LGDADTLALWLNHHMLRCQCAMGTSMMRDYRGRVGTLFASCALRAGSVISPGGRQGRVKLTGMHQRRGSVTRSHCVATAALTCVLRFCHGSRCYGECTSMLRAGRCGCEQRKVATRFHLSRSVSSDMLRDARRHKLQLKIAERSALMTRIK
jgi:hypothetical protein